MVMTCSKHCGALSAIQQGSPATRRPLHQRPPTFLAPGTGFVEDNFSLGAGTADGSGGNVSRSDGERQMKLRSLAHPPLTSCCAAGFLTDRGQVAVCSPRVGDPCPTLQRMPSSQVMGQQAHQSKSSAYHLIFSTRKVSQVITNHQRLQ